MTATTPLNIQLLYESAVAGHVTANEAVVILAWAAGGSRLVNTTATNTPPGSPANGDAYLLGGSPTGAWSGKSGIAVYSSHSLGWHYFTPQDGQEFYDRDAKERVVWSDDTSAFYPVSERWSTTEHWTGRYHGGTSAANRVYRKLVSIGSMPNATTKTTAHSISNLDLDAPIKLWGWCGITTSGFPFPVQFASSRVDVIVNATTVDVTTNANLSSYTGFVQLEYRKTS